MTTNQTPFSSLHEKLASRTATVGIVGLGYVGLPLAILFHEARFPIVGFDTDPEKPEKLLRGESYIRHIGSDAISRTFTAESVRATSDFAHLAECDAILICVPTPLGEHREPDLSYVRVTAEVIAEHLRPGQLVVLESTTYPGTTREVLVPRLERDGLRCGTDFFVAFSPEREDPGNKNFTTKQIPKVVGGMDEESLKLATELYGAALETIVPVSSPEVAEASKLLENIFRSVNIALVNELKIILDRMDINIWEVIEAAKTKPFGFMPFYPGPGLGGHCIPLDPFYLSWRASEFGVWARFIELAGEVNASMPRYVVQKTMDALNAQAKPLNGSSILVLGLSYKPDIDDDRESPSFEIIEMLREKGAQVSYCDPYFPKSRPGRDHPWVMESAPCTADEFARHDAVLLVTPHTEFKNPALYENAKLIIDTRGAVPVDTRDPRLVGA